MMAMAVAGADAALGVLGAVRARVGAAVLVLLRVAAALVRAVVARAAAA